MFTLAAVWALLWALGRVQVPESAAKAWPALALLGGWLVLQALFVIPLPALLISWLSPESARAQALGAAESMVSPAWMTLSVEPGASLVSLLKSACYAIAFVLCLLLLDHRSRVATLARFLVFSAVVLSIYAVLMHLAGARIEYFGMPIRHGDAASGTYVNRNHFAGYLEIVLALGIGLLLAGLSDRSVDSWRKLVRQTIDWILSPKMVLRLALCILVIALTTTHSRMGNSAFFASLLIAGVIGIALSRHATRNTVLLLASLIVIDLLIVGSWFGVEKLARRIEQTTVEEMQDREDPAAYSVALIKDYPVFGSGPGTFYVTFPRYRQEKVRAFFDQAHNDYAQFTCESGLAGAAIIGSFVVLSLGAALVAQWRRRDPLMRGMSFACIMGASAILIHSWVDFNLQIPANAILFIVLLALGWISLGLDRGDSAVPGTRAA